MRVSTFQMFSQQQKLMQTKQSAVSDAQTRLVRQEKIIRASDSPVDSSRLVDLRQQISRQEQFRRNSDRAEGQLFLQESALTSSETVLQNARDLVIRGQNAAFSVEDLRTIAMELQSINDDLLSFANSRNENGEYLFSGFATTTPAFERTGGGVVYGGDSGQRFIDVGETKQVAVNDPGDDVFLGSVNIFQVLDDLAEAFTRAVPDEAAVVARDADLATGLENLTTGLNHLIDTRARLGSRMQTVEQQRDYALVYDTELQRIASSINGLDMAEAASNLVRELTALDAAQQSFVQIQNLSLFRYLR